MRRLSVLPGRGKDGARERFSQLSFEAGRLYAVVGDTGSGKSRLIKDIEQLARGDSVTGRTVLVDGLTAPACRVNAASNLIAHLSQSMRFVLDTDVASFLRLHARCRNSAAAPGAVLDRANSLTPERIEACQNLNMLSGGQARALMIADIALICDSPVVLVDEVENAGIDKTRALSMLCAAEKLVLVVTHDPHTALMAEERIVMRNGAVAHQLRRSPEEAALLERLQQDYLGYRALQASLRNGETLL